MTSVVIAPEDAALDARRHLGVAEITRLDDILRLVEEEAEIPVVVAQLGDDGPDGVYTRARGRPFILVNSSSAPVRQRFTLAHELGHHYLGHGEIWDQDIRQSDKRPKEREANRFASEFLVPRAAIDWWFASNDDPDIDLTVLVRFAHHFRVSCEMARYRLQNVKRLQSPSAIRKLDQAIADRDHRSLQLQLGLTEAKDSLVLASKTRVRVPEKMKANVLWAMAQGLVDEGLAAKRLRLGKAKLREELELQGLEADNGAQTERVVASAEWETPPVPTPS